MTNFKIVTCLFFLSSCTCYNTSICGQFSYQGVYYFINQQHTNQNIQTDHFFPNSSSIEIIYNYCHNVQYYCEEEEKLVIGSLVVKDSCIALQQNSIQLRQQNKINKGVKVIYENQVNNLTVELEFQCDAKGNGCPRVQQSIVFDYLDENQLGFTITVQIIGILFMLLGIYIYRVTAVLIGAASIFFALIAIEAKLVFLPGVPDFLITHTLILTGICSFFLGYVIGYFPKVGVFFIGAWIGLIISLTLNNIAFYHIISDPANLTLWIVMPILSVAFGVLAVCVSKSFIIFATSLIGAYMCLRALSWHLGQFPNEFLFPRLYQLGLEDIVQWQFYLYIIALMILTASSSALQYWLFKKKLKKNNQSGNLEDHFEKMEQELKDKRENIIEFRGVFKEENSENRPKTLSKSGSSKREKSSSEEDEDNGELLRKLVVKKGNQ